MDVAGLMRDFFWPGALGALPIAVLVACLCRVLPVRRSTRHAMWLGVLGCLVLPGLFGLARPALVRVGMPVVGLPKAWIIGAEVRATVAPGPAVAEDKRRVPPPPNSVAAAL